MRVSRWPRGSSALLRSLFLAAPLAAACSSSSATAIADATADVPITLSGFDARAASDATVDAETLHTQLRLALMAPLGYGLDVCVRPNASMVYTGPLLYQQLPSIPDAGTDAAKKDAHVSHADAAGPDGGHDATLNDADAPRDAAADGESGAREGGSDGRAHEASVDATDDGPIAAHEGGDGRAPIDASNDAVSGVDAGERIGGVLYQQVSHYLTVATAGTFEVALVLGGSSTCDHPLAMQRITLDAGKLTTLVILGSGVVVPLADAGATDAGKITDASARDATRSPADASAVEGGAHEGGSTDGSSDAVAATVPLAIYALTDDPAVSPTLARARFFNATSGAIIGDAGVGFAASVSAVEQSIAIALAVDVPPEHLAAQHSSNPAVDALGYWEGAPLAATTPVSLRVGALGLSAEAGSGDAAGPVISWTFASTTSFDLTQARSNHTGFLIGNGDPGMTLVWCDDTSASNQTLTSCVSVASQ